MPAKVFWAQPVSANAMENYPFYYYKSYGQLRCHGNGLWQIPMLPVPFGILRRTYHCYISADLVDAGSSFSIRGKKTILINQTV